MARCSFTVGTTPALLALALSLASLAGPGCILAANTGQLATQSIAASDNTGTADIDVQRESLVVGTALDFRFVRVVSSIEMLNRQTRLNVQTAAVRTPEMDETYLERRFFRMDIPALSLWNFDGGGLGYPGLMDHRHSIDLWGRAGAVNIRSDFEGFAGAALTYYQSGMLAVSLTADHWSEPAQVQALNNFGSLTTFDASASGWVVGLEITVAAGEYGLDFIDMLVGVDAAARKQFPPRRASR